MASVTTAIRLNMEALLRERSLSKNTAWMQYPAQAFRLTVPDMTVVVPADSVERRQTLEAPLSRGGPTYIRIGRNPTPTLFDGAVPRQIPILASRPVVKL